jgi:hypothetical protein
MSKKMGRSPDFHEFSSKELCFEKRPQKNFMFEFYSIIDCMEFRAKSFLG